MVIFEVSVNVLGRMSQLLLAADGRMTDDRLRDETSLRSGLRAMMSEQGIQGSVGTVVALRGVSYPGCNYIYDSIPYIVAPLKGAKKEKRNTQVKPTNIERQTFLDLLTYGSRR
jgi:hypothetical protein